MASITSVYLYLIYIDVNSLPVHESVSVGRAPVREEEGDLVRGHRHQRDEVPEHVRVLQVGRGVPLLSVDKVRKQDWVPEMSSLVIVMLIKKLQNII